MINVNTTKKNAELWSVSHAINEMLYPTPVKFLHKEPLTGTKLSMVLINKKRVCFPNHLLFMTEKEAMIYASVNFIKLYYEFDPFMVIENVDEKTLKKAHYLVEKYAEEDPATYLYYWMGNVPNKF